MIINRYLMRTIHLGSFTVLLALVGMGMFFVFVSELGDLGEGAYDLAQIGKFVALSFPGKVVEFMPIAVLLGSILSLGSLASNNEIVAMQASGVSLAKLITSVLQAAVILALLSFLLAEWVVPASEASARSVKNLRDQSSALLVKEGLWIKDESRVLHIDQLLPNGIARNIEIFKLDPQGKVVSITRVGRAIPVEQGWELQQVERSIIGDNRLETVSHDRLIYNGSLSPQLLEVLMVKPEQMSSSDLYIYLNFLDENKLNANAEQLIFWQKIFSPIGGYRDVLAGLPVCARGAASGQYRAAPVDRHTVRFGFCSGRPVGDPVGGSVWSQCNTRGVVAKSDISGYCNFSADKATLAWCWRLTTVWLG